MSAIEVGALYRDIVTGFEGAAQPPDKPAEGQTYRLSDEHGTQVTAVGPHPTDPTKWVVLAEGSPSAIDRALLPLAWPRVGLQGKGPKGAPERRYFDPDRLQRAEG